MILSPKSNEESSAKSNDLGMLAALAAALLSAIMSSLCCLGPLLYLVFGISAAGLSGMTTLSWLQLPMIIISTCLMTFGFWRIHLAKKPLCNRWLNRKQIVFLYWLALPIILFMLFYPFVLPWLFEAFA